MRVRLLWDRITFSKLTISYFLFSVVHCIIQAALQIRAFSLNSDAAAFLTDIAVQANATDSRIPVVGNGDLRLCSYVPQSLSDISACQVIWNGSESANKLDKRMSGLPHVLVFNQNGTTEVIISGDGYQNTHAVLSDSCLWSLNWPISVLENTKREDAVFIAFQFWVLGMSVVALLNESIPHMFATLLTHILATSWSAVQLAHTANFRATFNSVITDGACNGIPLLPEFWYQRLLAEYPTLVLNGVALLVSGVLTWKLVKSFGWQTFKRVGASLTINRIYKLVLVLSIVLQLSFFFMAAFVSLWLDDLFNGAASRDASFITLYMVTSFATLVLLIPWIATGWFAVRQELRLPMFVFLVLSLLYLGAWGVMFLADTFRWAFLTWPFFSLMASASVFLTIVAFVLGVICRYNFGKGLLRYLNAQEPLPGDDLTRPSTEKVQFPSNQKPIPTFSATFGSGDQVPVPSQMFLPSNPRLGPRFYNIAAEPFETPRTSSLTRSSSQTSKFSSSSSSESFSSRDRWLLE